MLHSILIVSRSLLIIYLSLLINQKLLQRVLIPTLQNGMKSLLKSILKKDFSIKNNTLIAVSALKTGAKLITFGKHFVRIPGLIPVS